MKKITALILTFAILMLCVDFSASAEDKPTVSAVGAVLISADTGEIIYSHNSFQKLPMASTTKIMSAFLLLESGNLEVVFVFDSEAK